MSDVAWWGENDPAKYVRASSLGMHWPDVLPRAVLRGPAPNELEVVLWVVWVKHALVAGDQVEPMIDALPRAVERVLEVPGAADAMHVIVAVGAGWRKRLLAYLKAIGAA